jgi:nucleoside-diphosphate-sugar epimerase
MERLFSEYQVDAIIHLVGLPVIEFCERNPRLSFLLNVASVQNTLEAMRIADVKRIVFASSASIYGVLQSEPIREDDQAKPNTIYGHHKLLAEQVIKSYNQSYGIDYVIFRLFNVYGADPRLGKDVLSIFIRKALQGEPLIVKGPNKFRDFVHVDDVAQAFLKANNIVNTPNAVLNVGSGVKTSLGQLAKIVKEHFPKVETREEPASDDGTGLQANISQAKSILSFEPTKPEVGLNSHVSMYAANKGHTR